MTLRSLLPLFASLALASCTINGGDGDDDDGGDVSDSSDDSGDSGDSDDSGDSGDDSSDDASGDGDDPGDDSSDDSSGDSSDGPDAVDPRSGAWEYREYTPVSNDCDVPADYGNGGGGFGLVSNGDGSFTVFPNDDTAAFDCELDGADFVCPDRATERADVDPQLDATLVGQASAEGTFSDDENASGRQSAVIDCEGGDCALLEQVLGAEFPCTFEVDFVIDWRIGA